MKEKLQKQYHDCGGDAGNIHACTESHTYTHGCPQPRRGGEAADVHFVGEDDPCTQKADGSDHTGGDSGRVQVYMGGQDIEKTVF